MKPFGRRHFWMEYAIILSIAIVGGLVRYYMWDFMNLKPAMHLITSSVSLVTIAISWEYFRGVNVFLNRVFPFERSIVWRIALQIGLGLVFMLLVRSFIFEYARQFLPNQVDRMFEVTTYAVFSILSLAINLVFFTSYFIGRWKESLIRAERLEKEQAQVQLHNLKNQMNPHFLFNALSSLDSLIGEDQALASRFLQNLSKMYRYVLQHQASSRVPLRHELDFIRHFIFLLETRYQGALTIRIRIADACLEQHIVPVTLQVLMENAVKHNVIDADHPLLLEVTSVGDYLVVSNTRHPRRDVPASNGQGLHNLRSFYGLLTQRPVLVEETPDTFTVKVPLLEG